MTTSYITMIALLALLSPRTGPAETTASTAVAMSPATASASLTTAHGETSLGVVLHGLRFPHRTDIEIIVRSGGSVLFVYNTKALAGNASGQGIVTGQGLAVGDTIDIEVIGPTSTTNIQTQI